MSTPVRSTGAAGPVVLRHVVPVDDAPHQLRAGRIVHVDCRQIDVVEVWALATYPVPRSYLVTATGQAAPQGASYVGTALSPDTGQHRRGRLVWHLWELP